MKLSAGLTPSKDGEGRTYGSPLPQAGRQPLLPKCCHTVFPSCLSESKCSLLFLSYWVRLPHWSHLNLVSSVTILSLNEVPFESTRAQDFSIWIWEDTIQPIAHSKEYRSWSRLSRGTLSHKCRILICRSDWGLKGRQEHIQEDERASCWVILYETCWRHG